MKKILTLIASLTFCISSAQELNCKVKKGSVVIDKERDTYIMGIEPDGSGGFTIARTAGYTKKQGYIFEHYNYKLIKVKSHKHEMPKKERLVGIVMNNTVVNMIEYVYDKSQGAYICFAHSADVKDFKFEKKELFRQTMDKEKIPFMTTDANVLRFQDYYKAKIVFNEDKSAFGILVTINIGKKDKEVHEFYAYTDKLEPIAKNSVPKDYEDYAYEMKKLVTAPDNTAVYLVGKQENKDKDKGTPEYYYDVTMITNSAVKTFVLDTGTVFPESPEVIFKNGSLFCAGIYVNKDRKEEQGGFYYYELDSADLKVKTKTHFPYKEEIASRYESKKERDFESRALYSTNDGDVLLITEQFGTGTDASGKHMRYYFNDIMVVRINSSGEEVWNSVIEKSQIGNNPMFDFLSLTSMQMDDKIYLFVNGTIEKDEEGNTKVKFTPAPFGGANFDVLAIDANGKVEYKELIKNSQSKTRIMIDDYGVFPQLGVGYFMCNLGKEKQMVKVDFN